MIKHQAAELSVGDLGLFAIYAAFRDLMDQESITPQIFLASHSAESDHTRKSTSLSLSTLAPRENTQESKQDKLRLCPE